MKTEKGMGIYFFILGLLMWVIGEFLIAFGIMCLAAYFYLVLGRDAKEQIVVEKTIETDKIDFMEIKIKNALATLLWNNEKEGRKVGSLGIAGFQENTNTLTLLIEGRFFEIVLKEWKDNTKLDEDEVNKDDRRTM
jgi:hypothetical protein